MNDELMSQEVNTPVVRPGAAGAAFDQQGFVKRMMGDERLAQRIVHAFMDDMPRQLILLAQALSNTDAKALRIAAHTIKGAAATVGGLEIQEEARKVEQSATAGDLTAAEAALPELVASVTRAKPIMERFYRDQSD